MIFNVLQVIKNELDAFLRYRIETRESIVVLSELMHNGDGSFAVSTENRLILTLLNIEQERANLNVRLPNSSGIKQPFNINLYALFSAYYSPLNYEEALKTLTLTLAFFQGKQVFSPENTPSLPVNVDKIVVEIVNMDIKDISNFWAALGAKHMPSLLLKIRMISIDAEVVLAEEGIITGVDVEIGKKKPEFIVKKTLPKNQ